jgi:DNA invertase Pin-like site-specific DNA recombinase
MSTPALQAHIRLLESNLPRRRHEQQILDEGNRRGGMRQHNKPLWERMARAVRELHARGMPRFRIADELGVSRTYVTRVLGKKCDERNG